MQGNTVLTQDAPALGSNSHQLQGGTKQVSKQAPKPSFSLPSLGGKASQQGKKVKGQAKQASKQASKPSFSLPSLGGQASQVGKTAKIKAGSVPQKAKKAVSSGTSFFGTGSTRGKTAPAKAGASLGTRSTRPGDCLHIPCNVVLHTHIVWQLQIYLKICSCQPGVVRLWCC